jgi:Ca2+-binding EF-hand superfamily protein
MTRSVHCSALQSGQIGTLCRHPDVRGTGPRDPRFFQQHHGKEYFMKHITIIAAIAATLGAGAAYADHHGDHAAKLEAAFKAADKDGDGTLDKEEAKAMPRVAKNFDKIDADKDGTVDLKEIAAGMMGAMGKKTGKMHDLAGAKFATADKDADGTLDKEEAKGMKHVAEHFDEIDGDKDGTVSLDEIHGFMKSHMHGKKK